MERFGYNHGDGAGAFLPAKREVDVVAFGIVTAAILLFVAIGSVVGPSVVGSLAGRAAGPDKFILNAFLLNIAIVIFAWARYRELRQELHERKAAEHKARVMAETDPLTGFLNRRRFNSVVDGMIGAVAQDERAVAIMMVDLDNFKQVNDYNGHHVGDLLLIECARRIAAALPSGAAMGRIGGDEFAVAFPFEPDRPESVSRLAELLVAGIAQANEINAITIEVTGSIGIVRSDLPGLEAVTSRDATGLLEMADLAMYNAKRQGRNGFFWFEAAMAEDMRLRQDIERGIRQGIPRGEFIPYYERQIDVETGELVGFEMLARWDSPQFGIVAPDIFIPLAEEIGAICELSEAVIRQALEDARNWDTRLTLAINISPMQLRDPWFSQKLLKMMLAANFPPQRLEIEITESCLHQNVGQVRSLVASLKNQGVRISLDDFGTGYSSLAHLRTLPFDRIKIDRSFVAGVVNDRDSAAIVHAIALLGKGLNLPVTAEGVENSAVLECLRQYGGISCQGFLYGHPQPADRTLEWLGSLGLARSGGEGEPAKSPSGDWAVSTTAVERRGSRPSAEGGTQRTASR